MYEQEQLSDTARSFTKSGWDGARLISTGGRWTFAGAQATNPRIPRFPTGGGRCLGGTGLPRIPLTAGTLQPAQFRLPDNFGLGGSRQPPR